MGRLSSAIYFSHCPPQRIISSFSGALSQKTSTSCSFLGMLLCFPVFLFKLCCCCWAVWDILWSPRPFPRWLLLFFHALIYDGILFHLPCVVSRPLPVSLVALIKVKCSEVWELVFSRCTLYAKKIEMRPFGSGCQHFGFHRMVFLSRNLQCFSSFP